MKALSKRVYPEGDSRNKNDHLYPVGREFQDYWETVCNEPNKALMEKMQSYSAWMFREKCELGLLKSLLTNPETGSVNYFTLRERIREIESNMNDFLDYTKEITS